MRSRPMRPRMRSTAMLAGMRSLPEELQSEAGRRAWLARESSARDRADQDDSTEPAAEHEFDQARIVARCRAGMGGCLSPSASLTRIAGATRRGCRDRVVARRREAGVRLEDELEAERRGNKAYEGYRVHGREDEERRRLGAPPKPYEPPDSPPGEVNVTDPTRGHEGVSWVGAGLQRPDGGQREPDRAGRRDHHGDDRLWTAATHDPRHAARTRSADVSQPPPVALADAGSWNEQNMDDVTSEHGISVLIPPDSSRRAGSGRDGPGVATASYAPQVLASDTGKGVTANANTRSTGVRSHQTQPPHQPVSPTRQIRCADRVATDPDDTQPHQAPPPPAGLDRGLKPRSLATSTRRRASHRSKPSPPPAPPLRDSLLDERGFRLEAERAPGSRAVPSSRLLSPTRGASSRELDEGRRELDEQRQELAVADHAGTGRFGRR